MLSFNLLGDGLRDAFDPEAEEVRTIWQTPYASKSENLHVSFDTWTRAKCRPCDGVSFNLDRGRGAGHRGRVRLRQDRVTAYSIMTLILVPPGQHRRRRDSSVDGEDIVRLLREADAQTSAASEVSMIFQDPMTCLNPTYTMGNQLTEAILLHTAPQPQAEANARALEMLQLVGVNDAGKAR